LGNASPLPPASPLSVPGDAPLRSLPSSLPSTGSSASSARSLTWRTPTWSRSTRATAPLVARKARRRSCRDAAMVALRRALLSWRRALRHDEAQDARRSLPRRQRGPVRRSKRRRRVGPRRRRPRRRPRCPTEPTERKPPLLPGSQLRSEPRTSNRRGAATARLEARRAKLARELPPARSDECRARERACGSPKGCGSAAQPTVALPCRT
jgi:hypothetical protein